MNEPVPTTNIRLPVGVRDFLPRAAARRRVLVEALLGEFERWGYDRIITPAFEYADVLARGLGADAATAAIRFVEPATGEVVALRPDITPQIARVAATRLLADGGGGGPVRLCYEGEVLRLARGARGQRELIQAGVELIGAAAPAGDGEVLGLARAALARAGVAEVTLDVGHAALVREALAGVASVDLREALARKDEAGVARAARAADLPPRRRKLLEALPGLYGRPADVLPRARALASSAAALDELEAALALVPGEVTLDLGEVRGFEYYTGIRFSAYIPGAAEAVLRGGRYDELIGRYGRAARATGFAVDVEALAGADDGAAAAASAAILVAASDPAAGFRVAAALRGAGVRAVHHLEAPPRGVGALRAAATAAGAASILVVDGARSQALAAAGGKARKPSAAALAAAAAGRGAKLCAELRSVGK